MGNIISWVFLHIRFILSPRLELQKNMSTPVKDITIALTNGNNVTEIPLQSLLPGAISPSHFRACLQLYKDHVRDVYQAVEDVRFRDIPNRLVERSPQHLTKNEVVDLDRWIQKRGVRLDKKFHNRNANLIQMNEDTNVENITEEALKKYSATNPLDAIKILKKLTGVGRSRASLILSAARPKTMPFISWQLGQWTCWDPQVGWTEDPNWGRNKNDATHISAVMDTVNEVIRGLMTTDGPDAAVEITAVDVEKVAFVLQRESAISDLRNTEIPEDKQSEHLGQGTFAFVYKALGFKFQGQKTPEFVAVKRILKIPSLRRHRLFSETEISSLLAKGNPERFVQFYGCREDAHNFYVAMEYIKFGDLGKILRDKRDISPEWGKSVAKKVTTQILEGLVTMHQLLVAHRDLKPENILIVCLDEICIKISDFGVSKKNSDRGTTIFKTYAGTQAYKAPEVVERWGKESSNTNAAYTEKVDIWSLGCIIYRMVEGRLLFPNGNDVPDKNKGRRLQNMNKLLEGDQSEHKFMRKLLRFNAQDRPSAAEALKALSEEWH
ncbi:kinase-like domain-containing protein [Pestalotiopsis sp. NC0098]|nr:kinase-like domain-containing protein [Pestalotiopsis sp. NC0098]